MLSIRSDIWRQSLNDIHKFQLQLNDVILGIILNIAVVLLSLWSTCSKNDVSENIRLLYPHNEALMDKYMFKVNNNAFAVIFSNFVPTGVFFVYSCIIPAQFFSILVIAGFEKYVFVVYHTCTVIYTWRHWNTSTLSSLFTLRFYSSEVIVMQRRLI